MTKETKKIDYSQFSYLPNDEVIISGELFSSVGYLLEQLKQKEQKVYFKNAQTQEEFYNQEPELYITEDGMAIQSLTDALYEAHMKNVEEGRAKSKEEVDAYFADLRKPKVSLEA